MKKRYVLKGKLLFKKVYENGKRSKLKDLRVIIFKIDNRSNKEDNLKSNKKEIKLGISVNRRVGNAPERNRIKRRLRSVFSEVVKNSKSDCYIIVQPYRGLLKENYQTLNDRIINFLKKEEII